MQSHYRSVLKRGNFLCLWIGQIISQFGDRLTQMALIGMMSKFEPGSSVGLAKILSLAIIPVFIISPISGAYVDRWDKRKTMYISELLRGCYILVIPWIIGWQLRPLIYVLIFLSFCVGRFFIPAKMAVIPSLVEKDELFLANSLVSITSMIAAILGFGFGGLITEKWGVESAFKIDAATFFISATLIFFMRTKENKFFHAKDILELGKDAILQAKTSLFFEIREGFKYFFRSEETLYSLKIRVVLFAVLGSLYTVFIIFMQKVLSTVTGELGWLAVATGSGLFIGSLLYGRFGAHSKVKPAINFSLLLAGMHLLVFTSILNYYPSKGFAFFSCFLLGIFCSPVEIALNSLIHNETENDFLGRIFSSLEIILHLAFLLFMFCASILAEIMTPFTIIASCSIILILFALFEIIMAAKK